MKLFCCYTEAHRRLLDEFFRPSLDPLFQLYATAFDITGAGGFLSPEFIRCVRKKVELILASLRDHDGEIIVWSDVDIHFLRPVVDELRHLLESSRADLLFQREGKRSAEVNTGFFVCHCSPRVTGLFERVLARMIENRSLNEQYAMNQLLPNFRDISWGFLPNTFYARTLGWPPPRDLVLYHANFTAGKDGVGQKIRQFRELAWVRRHGAWALGWSCLKRLPGKLARELGRLRTK